MRHNAAPRWATQSWRYLAVAGLTALGYLGLMGLGLIAGLHYFVAILIAQAITILCAFPYYRRFVFESTSGLWPDFARFLLVWTAGAASGIVVTPLLVELLHWRPFDAQAIAIAVVGVGSFLAHRFFTFPRSEAALSAPMAITGSRPRVRGMNLSVVIPCYRSVLTLDALVARLLDSLSTLTVEGAIDDFEVILVVDGSPDATGAMAIRLAEESEKVAAIVMRRNFGQHNALVAGIRAARHEVVVTLDDDLQHPPEEIGTLLRALDDPAVDLVYAVPTALEHGVLRSLASHSVKGALRLSGVAHADWVGAFRAFRTELREGFRDVNDAQVNLDVLLSWVTTRVRAVQVDMDPRAAGHSTYGLRRLVRHTLNMVTGYGTVPLKLATWLGFACGLLGAVLLVTVVVRYFRGETTVPGFTTLAALISLFAGAQMLTIGIIGEYLGRQHFRSMSRPMYVIGEVHSSARAGSSVGDEATSAQPPEQEREQRMPGAGA